MLTYSTLSALDQDSNTATFDDSSSSIMPNTASIPATQTTAVSMTSISSTQSTPSFVAPPVIGNDENQAQSSGGTSSEVSNSQSATSTQATDGFNSAVGTASASLASTPLASTTPVVEIPASNTYQFAAVTLASTSGAPKPSSTVQYPNAQNGNAAMASGFNQIYKTLSETSSCDADDSNQAFSCISGELAQCQSDGTYVLKSCPQGQSCYALPLPSGQTGISVECAVPGDAAARLAGQPSATSPAVSAVSEASSTVQGPATQTTPSVQGGYVVGGFNTPTTSVEQQAQKTTSLPSAEGDSNNQAETAVSQTSATTPSAQMADQPSATSTTLQKAVPVTSSAPQAATEAPPTTASQSPDAKPVDQFSTSQLTTVVKPVEQSSTSQNTMEVSPTTAASQLKNTKSENQPSVTVTTTKDSSPTPSSGPLFSVLTPNPSSVPAEQEQQQQPTATSILALPAAAKNIPETTPTTGVHQAGVTIVPMTPPPSNNNENDNNNNNNNNNPGNNDPAGINNSGGNNVVEEKVVANSAGNSPIYITVTTTVTTTAYNSVATA